MRQSDPITRLDEMFTDDVSFDPIFPFERQRVEFAGGGKGCHGS